MANIEEFSIESERELGGGWRSSPAETLRGVLRFLRRQGRVIVFTTASGVTLAGGCLLVTPPSYTSSVLMVVDPKRVQMFQPQQETTGETPIDSTAVDSQVEILRSENVLVPVIRELNLAREPEFAEKGLIEAASALWSVFSVRENGADFALSRRTLHMVEDRLIVRRIGQTHVIEASFRARSPELAAKVANAVADAYVEDQLQAKYDAARRASGWLQERIAQLQYQATAAEQAVFDFKSKHDIVDAGGRLMSEQELAELNSQLGIARAQVSEARAKLDRIQAIINNGNGAPVVALVADTLKSEVVTKLRSQFIELAIREADWAHRYGPMHLAVVRLRDQMSGIRKSAIEELSRLAETYKSDYDIAKAKEEGIEREIRLAVARFRDANRAQIALRDLESAAKSARLLHDNFMQRNMESIQHQSLPSADARVISPASQPLQKSHPKIALSLVMAALGGSVLGLAIASYRDLSDRVFRTSGEVEEFLPTGCVTLVPKMRDGQTKVRPLESACENSRRIESSLGAERLIMESPRSRFAESIQSIRLGLERGASTRAGKVVGITSSVPGEGKSTIAACLARTIAQADARVLLIDCDLREPELTRTFTPSAEAGIVEVAKGLLTLDDAAWRDTGSNLTFLPAVVQSEAHPAELFVSQEAERLFARLHELYDWVLVDLPPLAPVVDTSSTSRLVDEYLLIVEWGATKIDVLHRTLQTAPQVRDRVRAVALNKVDLDQLAVYDGTYERYNSKYYRELA